jgi:hypothetical protein
MGLNPNSSKMVNGSQYVSCARLPNQTRSTVGLWRPEKRDRCSKFDAT